MRLLYEEVGRICSSCQSQEKTKREWGNQKCFRGGRGPIGVYRVLTRAGGERKAARLNPYREGMGLESGRKRVCLKTHLYRGERMKGKKKGKGGKTTNSTPIWLRNAPLYRGGVEIGSAHTTLGLLREGEREALGGTGEGGESNNSVGGGVEWGNQDKGNRGKNHSSGNIPG